jgi:large subunit ribosomal protein L19
MAEIKQESIKRMNIHLSQIRPPFPDFHVGDAVEINYGAETADKNPVLIRGTVIAKRNKGLDSNFSIINSWDGEWYSATYTLSSPLLRTIRIMKRNRHHEDTKRARRAKLSYLFDKDPKYYLVDNNTKELAEIQKEKIERRLIQASGGVYKKGKGPASSGAAAKGKPAAAAGGKPAAAPAKK